MIITKCVLCLAQNLNRIWKFHSLSERHQTEKEVVFTLWIFPDEKSAFRLLIIQNKISLGKWMNASID